MKKRKRQKSQIPLYLALAGGLLLIITAVLLNGANEPSTNTSVPAHEEGYPEIERVTLANAKSALEAGTAVIIDVRAAEAYQAAHITGAISIPSNELETRLSELNKDEWIITYCT